MRHLNAVADVFETSWEASSYITGKPEVASKDRLSTMLARSPLLENLIFAAPEFGNIVSGVFTPVLAKHSKSFSLIDCISVGVDRMQRNFDPMRKQVEAWQRSELTDVTAKIVIYVCGEQAGSS